MTAQQYLTEYVQVPDKDDERGYHWKPVRRIKADYTTAKIKGELGKWKQKKGAKWENIKH